MSEPSEVEINAIIRGARLNRFRFLVTLGLCIALVLMTIPPFAFARTQTCRDQAISLDSCRSLAGTYFLTADDLWHLQPDGSPGSLSIRGDPDIPKNLAELLIKLPSISAQIHGEFQVCTLPGRNRFDQEIACIERSDKLSIVEPSGRSKRKSNPTSH